MGLFNDNINIKTKKPGRYWKITELANSFKFSLGSVDEFIEVDELLGRGEAFKGDDKDFSFFRLLKKLEDLVPNYQGIEFDGFTMVRIRQGNPGLLLKKEERELDFVSDKSLKTMTFIHAIEQIRRLQEPEDYKAIESNEAIEIDQQNRERGSEEQFGLASTAAAESLQN